MPNLTSKNMGVKIDNASSALTDISGNVNQASLETAFTILRDSALGDAVHTNLHGLRETKIPLNGWLNSTVDAILGILKANGTSVTKTIQFQEAAARFYYGEANVENIKYGGSTDTLQTWSANFVFSGAINRTSVTQS